MKNKDTKQREKKKSRNRLNYRELMVNRVGGGWGKQGMRIKEYNYDETNKMIKKKKQNKDICTPKFTVALTIAKIMEAT